MSTSGIATAALGFEGDCVKNEDSQIFKLVKDAIPDFTKFSSLFKVLLVTISPKLYKAFGLQFSDSNLIDFLRHVTIDTMREREENNVSRPDMIQLLLEVRKGKGQLKTNVDDLNDAELRNYSAHKEYSVNANKVPTTLDIDDDDLWIGQ